MQIVQHSHANNSTNEIYKLFVILLTSWGRLLKWYYNSSNKYNKHLGHITPPLRHITPPPEAHYNDIAVPFTPLPLSRHSMYLGDSIGLEEAYIFRENDICVAGVDNPKSIRHIRSFGGFWPAMEFQTVFEEKNALLSLFSFDRIK